MEETEKEYNRRKFIKKLKWIGFTIGTVAIGYNIGKRQSEDKFNAGFNTALLNDYLQLTKPTEDGPVGIPLNEWNVEIKKLRKSNR